MAKKGTSSGGDAPLSAAFDEARKLFPLRTQARTQRAAELLTQEVEKGAGEAASRAKSWLAYAYATAVVDRWSWRGFPKVGGNSAAMLLRKALAMAEEAVAEGAGKSWLYDAYWGLAFVAIMSGDGERASDAVNKGLREAGKRPLPHFRAEMADLLVYLGDIKRARAEMELALQEGEASPPWFHWVDAWVTFAEASTATDPQLRRKLYNAVCGAISAMVDVDDRLPKDLDAAILAAAAHAKAGRTKLANRLVKQVKVGIRDLKGETWSIQMERKRAPFLTTLKASPIQKAWEEGLDEAFA